MDFGPMGRFFAPRTVVLGAFAVILAGVSACTGVNNAPGTPTSYSDPGTAPPPPQGLGIQSNDIVSMTDQMMRDMLTEPRLAAQAKPPRVILDAEYFHNESRDGRVNTNTITDRLRVSLSRASRGRMVFVGRHYAGMVESERQVKRDRVTDTGTQGLAAKPMGADFRLGGRITALAERGARYTQIVFEMVDLETSEIVWSGMYEFNKTSFNANTAGEIDVAPEKK
ncbi:MAG: penicillin-binding protein activator LpoB [Alphaproteobacteria bacterium]